MESYPTWSDTFKISLVAGLVVAGIAFAAAGFENFTIIYQEQGGGKIKAINDCLKYVLQLV